MEREDPMMEQGCWQDLSPHRGPTLGQFVPEGLQPAEGTHAGIRNAAHGKHSHWRSLGRTVSHGRGKKLEKNGSEVEPRKKRGVRGKYFKIWFYFLLSYCDLIGSKLN